MIMADNKKKFSKLSSQYNRLLCQLRGESVEYDLSTYEETLRKIRAIDFSALNNKEIKKIAGDLRQLAKKDKALEDLLPAVFALVAEICHRLLKMSPFDCQMMAAIALHNQKLVQMQTGEGKTLAAVMPAVLDALKGDGVHILTANDYLARRDAGWMGPVYRFFGLTVGFIQENMSLETRRQAYGCDITYLTAKEAGFDFLRDNLGFDISDTVQRPFHFVIVDEADFIMIDEARIPLVIAGQAPMAEIDHQYIARIIGKLKPDVDFQVDEYARNVYLTESGIARIENIFDCGSIYDNQNLLLFTAVNLALQAKTLLHRDIDYIVRDGQIELIDEFTGRVADRRRWPDGIQSAVEAKEKLDIQPEGKILGSITIQNFINLYPRISGMTATALSAAEEFKEFYGLDVVVVPPNRPCIRREHSDQVFSHKQAKNQALVEEIIRLHKTGRPILVGTASVSESEEIAGALTKFQVSCQVLNAKNDEKEAKVISRAGMLGAVTISTNMAGRGTDILLGGPEGRNREKILKLGGLYVMGTNRHESRRIDYQLRGRAGRQGDSGESRFFISLEDDLIGRYGVVGLIPRKHRPDKQKGFVDDPVVGREIARAQRIIEGQNFEIRQTLWLYSSLVEAQRRIFFKKRKQVMIHHEPLDLVEKRLPKYYRKVCDLFGTQVVQRVERKLTLYFMDKYWSEHLAEITDIKEGIYLRRFAGRQPVEEFQIATDRAFQKMLEKINDDIVRTFQQVKISNQGIDLEKEDLKRPTSTWTYLVNDNPFSSFGMSLMASRNLGSVSQVGIVAVLHFPLILALLVVRFFNKIIAKGLRRQKK